MLAGMSSFVARARVEAAAAAAGVGLVLVTGDHFFLHEDTGRGVALVEEHLG
jgi:surfactin synthase thioesterase subunit